MWLSWQAATERALYGDGGFYRRSERPSAHFRTSVHVSARFADALSTLLYRVDGELGRPARLQLVDLGAGDGELLTRLVASAPDALAARLHATAVEVRERPAALPERIRWRDRLPERVTGLVIANEWLDNIPLDVVELAGDGPRLVLVDPATGEERLGDRPAPEQVAWLDRWWPLTSVGERAEIGLPRDRAWAELTARLRGGCVLAVDYGHERGARPRFGTLAGFRHGRAVRPVPDGSRDICAHVAVDSCLAAVAADRSGCTTQRAALRALGLDGRRPPLRLARTDPAGYLDRLRLAGEEGELLDPAGLGRFYWLTYSVGVCPLGREGATLSG